ncbi:hypothetical protein P692DRAFT_20839537, partial [Suillus brevipes Sb2]
MDSDWDVIQKCLQFRPKFRLSADEVLDLVMRRLSSSDSSIPFDNSSDDAQGAFHGAPPHRDSDSDDSDMIGRTSTPRLPDRELTN